MTQEIEAGSVRWIHEVRVDGAVTFRRGKLGDRMVADWPGFARLTCERDGRDARLVPAGGVSSSALDTLHGAPINALLHDLAGKLALHASAVAIDGRAVLFVGANGSGKSTAAAELCLRHGAELLADDAALLEMDATGVFVLPSEGCHSLTSESYVALGLSPSTLASDGDKGQLRPSNVAPSPCPLAVVVALRFGPARTHAALLPLRGGDAARLLLAATIRFDIEDGRARRRDFEQVAAIHSGTPFLELSRPTDAPGAVAPFILDVLRKAMP